MSRWFTTLLFIGVVCLVCGAPLLTPAYADGDDTTSASPAGVPADTSAPAPAQPVTLGPLPASSTTTPAATLDVSTAEFPSKSAIRDALSEGRPLDAEQAYLEWVAFWGEDDPALAAIIEHATLLQAYRNGKFSALLDMVRAGDRDAVTLLHTQILSGQSNLPPAQLAVAIRLLGLRKDNDILNTLRLALYSKDTDVVNAAIEAMGNLGDRRVAPDLQALFEKANIARSVILARALTELGFARELRQRYTPQLRFPLPGAQEQAALILGATGVRPVGQSLMRSLPPEIRLFMRRRSRCSRRCPPRKARRGSVKR